LVGKSEHSLLLTKAIDAALLKVDTRLKKPDERVMVSPVTVILDALSLPIVKDPSA
jgi:hypothetical protein